MLPNEPQTIGRVLDTGFNLYRRTFKSIAAPAIGFAVLMTVLNVLMMSAIDFEALAAMPTAEGAPPPSMQHVGAVFFLLWIASLLTFLLFFIVVAHRQWALANDRVPALADDVMRGLALLVPLTFASILYYVVTMIGFVLLIVPGVILLISMSLYVFVPIVEDRAGWFAIRRSHGLVWGGNWWRTAAVFTVVSVITIVLSLALQLVIGTTGGLDALMQPTKPSIVASAGSALMFVVMYPLVTAVMLALYNDLLIRKEGGDLDSRLEALQQPAS